MDSLVEKRIEESIRVKKLLMGNKEVINNVQNLAERIADAIKNDCKVILCGNGGSASDALHFAGEIVGRYQKERQGWPAVVLNADVATMTAIANDYGYDEIFARQVEGHVKNGDVFVGISTSGNSENVYRAALKAKKQGAFTAAFLGNDGGKISHIVDCSIIVPHNITARIQESHILLIHIICELIEDRLSE